MLLFSVILTDMLLHILYFLLIMFISQLLLIFISLIVFLLGSFPISKFNFWLDRFFPSILLLFPPITCFFVLYPVSLLSAFSLFLFIHVVLVIPILYWWSNVRSWTSVKSSDTSIVIRSWNSPQLLYNISLAIIYPCLYGIYYSSIRYLRIGQQFDVFSYISSFSFDWILLIFIFPFTFYFLLLIFVVLKELQAFLWSNTSNLIYSIHLHFISFNWYFVIYASLMFLVHQSYFMTIHLKRPILGCV